MAELRKDLVGKGWIQCWDMWALVLAEAQLAGQQNNNHREMDDHGDVKSGAVLFLKPFHRTIGLKVLSQ